MDTGIAGARGPSRRALLTGGAGLATVLAGAAARAAQPAIPLGPQPPPPLPAPPPPPPVVIPALSDRQAETLLKALTAAPSHGFNRDEFGGHDLAAVAQAGGADAQTQLKAATLAYARAQRGQRIPLSAFPTEWSVRPTPYDPAPDLAQAVAQDRLGPWLDSLPPPFEGYNGLKTALARYRAIAAGHGWKPVPDGPPLAQGADDPRVAALRRRLAAEDPDALDDTDSTSFDADLTQAVIAFQRRYGQVADGVVGPPTLVALNAPVSDHIQHIKANMERWRWLPRELPPSRIQVNIAAAVMAVYEDDRPVMAMKAVAGRPDDATPMLQSRIQSIVLNPPWHVPQSIAAKEIWPKTRGDRGYLARHAYVVRKADDGTMHIIQKAGPKSALGRFKFDFDNPFGVYLHDTPVQSGFSRTSRLASHGCVRLEHPKALADLLLTGDPAWPPDRVAEAVTTEDTRRVALAQPMPVFILYWTAFVGGGEVQFRNDSYDWDRKLLDLLAAHAA